MSNKVSLVDIEKRSIVASKKDNDIYHNGIDNDYPERTEGVINNSVTAKLCATKMKQYIFGRGFNINNDFKINTSGKTLFELHDDLSNDVPYQKSIAIHVNYDNEYNINTFNSIRSKKVRLSKEDIFDNKGLIWVSDNWSGSKMRSKKKSNGRKFYYPFNPSPEAISAQRNRDFEAYLVEKNIKKSSLSPTEILSLKLTLYRGQVIYMNLDNNDIYANTYIDPAYNDADTEYRISNFRNKQVRDGFIGSTIFTVLDNGEESEDIVTDKMLKGLMGSDNAHKVLKVNSTVNSNGDMIDVIKADTVKSEIDTERFKYDEQKIEENILNSFNNIPKILVKGSDASFFGTSGEVLKIAKETYNENTLYERMCVEKAVNIVLKYIKNPFSVKIIDILGSNLNDQNTVTQ